MPIVLLLLGVVTTAAGLVLVGSGLSPRDGTFQTEVLTPGTIAAVGGLLVIAFGLAVREMRRIERSFAVRSASRTPRVDDAATVAASSAATSGRRPCVASRQTGRMSFDSSRLVSGAPTPAAPPIAQPGSKSMAADHALLAHIQQVGIEGVAR